MQLHRSRFGSSTKVWITFEAYCVGITPDGANYSSAGQILKDANTVDSYGECCDHLVKILAFPTIDLEKKNTTSCRNLVSFSAGIGNDHVVHLVKSKPPAGSAPTPTGGITTQQLTNMHRTSDPMVKHFESMGMSVDAAEQQAAGMRDMMSSPEWQAQFEALTNNPDAMRAMIEADPRAREMLRQVPEMRAVFNDPQELQRMARVMANPVSKSSYFALFPCGCRYSPTPFFFSLIKPSLCSMLHRAEHP